MEILKPAQLAFFAIYNPALGLTDETLPNQLVYYYSGKDRESKSEDSALSSEQRAKEEQNEQLRNIGLAQGMVAFGKAFADGDNVDFVDSEKSRIFMHELEPNWWVLASVNLTQLRITTTSKGPKGKSETKVKVEYSGREVSPQGLLLQQILTAHSVFLLHHGSSLAEIYTRSKRTKFCAALDRFWSQFLRKWDVLLHGTPAVDVFQGIKLAAGGELGVGVGEEDWGSGEREVLEDFTQRTSGQIDVVVSHFDDTKKAIKDDPQHPWLGNGLAPTSSDGVVYSGTGKISSRSTASVSKWMQWMFQYGPSTYGVQDNPHTSKRRKRKKDASKNQTQGLDAWPTGIPPPLKVGANKPAETAPAKVKGQAKESQPIDAPTSKAGTDVLMKYMTFGLYGSGWGLPTSKDEEQKKAKVQTDESPSNSADKPKQEDANAPKTPAVAVSAANEPQAQSKPYFLIGLQGSLEDDGENETEDDSDPGSDGTGMKSWNNRILLRTLYVERQRPSATDSEDTADEKATSTFIDRVQVIVYINQPFVFTFLFELNTPTLSYVSFYKSIHHQLGPLRKPMLKSTSSETIHNRLFEVVSPRTVTSVDSKQPIYDLIYDRTNFTIHTTIPPIPDVNDTNAEWSRLDALNVHLQIINTKHATRLHLSEIERTAKTARGWWVVWMNFPAGAHKHSKEAFLVRKSTDYVEESGRKGSFGFGKDIANWGTNAGRVAEGIGIDARRYVEGLISLSR